MPHLHIDVGFSKIVTQTNQSVDNAELKRQFLLSSMLINKTAFEKIGLFDESMQFYGSDLDWVFRAREEKLNFHMHDQPTLHYYLHENNHSKNEEMFKNARIEVMKKSIQRRKSANSKAIESIPGFINSSKK
jgi:GT2 family glycosyltransferase